MSNTPAAPLDDHVSVHVANGIGFIELTRPKALNALSLQIVRAMHQALTRWRDDKEVLSVVVFSRNARAFCAGGDLRFLYEVTQAAQTAQTTRAAPGNETARIDTDGVDDARVDTETKERFFVEEYRLNQTIFNYPKPYIAFLNGIVMGGGMGISQTAPRTGGIRVVTPSTRMAMPETRIGLFPDVGAGWFLSRTPGAVGRYLAITGESIGAADAIYADLADVLIDDDALPGLMDDLGTRSFADGADVVAFIRQRTLSSDDVLARSPSQLSAVRGLIDRHFSFSDMAEIVASLRDEQDPLAAAWTDKTRAGLSECSPLSMCVSLEIMKRHTGSMADTLRQDLILTHTSFSMGDVIEGIRAKIISKDNRPRWRFESLAAVPPDVVDAMFSSPWASTRHPLHDLAD